MSKGTEGSPWHSQEYITRSFQLLFGGLVQTTPLMPISIHPNNSFQRSKILLIASFKGLKVTFIDHSAGNIPNMWIGYQCDGDVLENLCQQMMDSRDADGAWICGSNSYLC